MKRFLILGIIILSVTVAFADGLQSDAQYRELIVRQKVLTNSQDSLRTLLALSRSNFEAASEPQREVISQTIVGLEGEIYDVRSQLGRLGGQIAAIEQKYAEQSLQVEARQPQIQSPILYDNNFFKDNLSTFDISKLKSLTGIADNVRQIGAQIVELYDRLKNIKLAYDSSLSQSDVDKLGVQAFELQSQIKALDEQIADAWQSLYNFAIENFLILLDKAGAQDRTLLESLENEGRKVRRMESLAQQQLMAPNLAAFDAQRSLVLTYEKVLAKELELSVAANLLSARKLAPISVDLPVMTFEPRVLTIYGDIETGVTYNSDNVDDVPQLIIPDVGNYYSVQISLLNSRPKDLNMFKGAYPLQYQKTSDGKYRFMAGGFSTYAQALKGVSALSKAGFKYPVMVAWSNGKWATPSKIRSGDVVPPVIKDDAGAYIIKISTTESTVAEKLRSVIDQHAKGKNIARIAAGDKLEFTITEFESKNEAEAVAQIVRLNVTPDVSVEKL